MNRLTIFSLATCGTVVLLSHSAQAQLPFPIMPERPKPKTVEEPETKDATPEKEKDYTKFKKAPLPEGEARALEGDVAVITFEGIVNPGMGEFTIESIKRAERENMQAILIKLNTPGGLVSTTEKIVQNMLPARVPVIVYVTPSGAHAASAGTFITLAGHVAAMAPATRMGAAHPVTGGGQDPEAAGGKHMAKKIENDLVALMEGIASERNRNVEWAKDAVLDSISTTAEKCVKFGAVDLVASDQADLFEKLDGFEFSFKGERVALKTKDVRTVEYKQSMRSAVLNFLANPTIAMLLGLLGMMGIIIEIKAPGMYIPGIMGVLCILTAAISMEQLPIDVGAVILIVAGLGLLIAEFYTPTYGALTLLGGAGLTIGMLLLVDTADPDFAIDPSIELTLTDVLPLVFTFVGFTAFLSYMVVKSQGGKPFTGLESLVGTRGRVLRPIGPEGGQVFVGGEYWQARATEEIKKDEEIEVVKVDGLELEVRRHMGDPS